MLDQMRREDAVVAVLVSLQELEGIRLVDDQLRLGGDGHHVGVGVDTDAPHAPAGEEVEELPTAAPDVEDGASGLEPGGVGLVPDQQSLAAVPHEIVVVALRGSRHR